MQLVVFAIIGFFTVVLGLVVLVLSLRWMNSDDLSSRLETFVEETNISSREWNPRVSEVRRRELTGSIISRALIPVLRRVGQFIGRWTPARTIEELNRKLTIAGNPMGIGAREFYALRFILVVIGGWMALLLMRGGFDRNRTLGALSIALLFVVFPQLWLVRKVRFRQDKIRKGLPDALDMLSVCSTAGLGFDQALQRVSEQWKTSIGEEFGRVIGEMEMGLSRHDALRNLAERVDISELTSFVSLLLQSDQLGMSISDTLHAQADQMRIERRFRAQEQANKIPTKMLIPMTFLIFPAILAVLLGPAIPPILDTFSNMQ